MEQVINAIVSTFYKAHQYKVETVTVAEIQSRFKNQYESIVRRLKSWEWTFGETPSFVYHYDEMNHLKVKNGIVDEVVGKKLESVFQLEEMMKFTDQLKEV